MAQSYQQRNAASIAATGKTLYARRIERAQAAGLSRDQARGHPNYKRAEPLITQLPPERRPQRQKPTAPRPTRPQKPITKLRTAHRKGYITEVKKSSGTHQKSPEKVTQIKGVAWEGERLGRMQGVIDDIASVNYSARVQITVQRKDGEWITLYKHGGREAASLADDVDSADSMYDWLMDALEDYGQDADDFGAVGELNWQVIAY